MSPIQLHVWEAPTFASPVSEVAGRIAERFLRGGRLFAFSDPAGRDAARDLVWLFANPPFGRPLAAETADAAQFATSVGRGSRPEDIALGVVADPGSHAATGAFEAAHRRGLLTVAVGQTEGAICAHDDCVDCRMHMSLEDQTELELWQRVQQCLTS